MLMTAGLDWLNPEICSSGELPSRACDSPLESLHFGANADQLEHEATFHKLRGIRGFVKTAGKGSRLAEAPDMIANLDSLVEYLHAALSACQDPMETVFVTLDKALLNRRLIDAQQVQVTNSSST